MAIARGSSNSASSAGGRALTLCLARLFSPANRNLRNVVLGLILVFILRNILRHDYRREEMTYLRESGMTDGQIERYIPKTKSERKEYVEDRKIVAIRWSPSRRDP